MNNTKKRNAAFKSPWVWAIICLFLIVFTVNYNFISLALNTTSGLVTEKYYKHGLQQNKYDKLVRDQEKRGWKVELHLVKAWQAGVEVPISIAVTDAYGQAITKGRAEVSAYRPSDATVDVVKPLKETSEKGVYATTMTLPIQGVWDINVLFSIDDKKHMLNKRTTILGDGNPTEPTTLEKIVDFLTPS